MENTFENAGHSYTEAGHFDPVENKKPTAEEALRGLVALHHREIKGDETITTKEWAQAIRDGELALDQEGK